MAQPVTPPPLPTPAATPTLAGPELLPGDLATAECPTGSTPALKAGDALPHDKPAFTVVRVDGNKVLLGPLHAGELTAEVPCGNGAVMSFRVKITEVKKEDLAAHEAALGTERLAYPAWFWAVIAAILLTAIGNYFYWTVRHRRKMNANRKRPPAPKKNPDEKFDQFLKVVSKEHLADSDTLDSARRLYADGYELMRGYLEYRMDFKAVDATTREFMGALKAAILQWNAYVPPVPKPGAPPVDARPRKKLDTAFANLIDTLMSQADQVRFAAEKPPVSDRQAFLRGLERVKGTL